MNMSSFPGKAVENSNFTQTCNLLSQFFKDKRSSSLSSLPLTAKAESKAATVDLLNNLQNSDEASAKDFLPQFMENQSNLTLKSFVAESENPQPQMTIFYNGKVLVFDAFPPEKATEVMEFATKLGSDDLSADTRNPSPTCSARAPLAATDKSTTVQQPPRSGPQSSGSDMRYPRRASLLKFLEKRKERVIARGPYQKQEESSSGGDPAENHSSKHLDLNL